MLRTLAAFLIGSALATGAVAESHTLTLNIPDGATWEQSYTLEEKQDTDGKVETTWRNAVIKETATRQEGGYLIRRTVVSFEAKTDKAVVGLSAEALTRFVNDLGRDMITDHVADVRLKPLYIKDWDKVRSTIRTNAVKALGSAGGMGMDMIFKHMTAEAATGILVPLEALSADIRDVALEPGVPLKGKTTVHTGIAPQAIDSATTLTLTRWDTASDTATYTYLVEPDNEQTMTLMTSFIQNMFNVLGESVPMAPADRQQLDDVMRTMLDASTMAYVITCDFSMRISTGLPQKGECIMDMRLNMPGSSMHSVTRLSQTIKPLS